MAGVEEKPKLRRGDTSQRRSEAGAEEIPKLRQREATQRQCGTAAGEKLKLRRRGDGMRRPGPWRTRREPRANEAFRRGGLARRDEANELKEALALLEYYPTTAVDLIAFQYFE